MPLDASDLPEDPFGATGMAQVRCGQCLNDLLHFVYTADGTVKAICPQCKTVAGEWPGSPPWAVQPEPGEHIDPARDALPPPVQSGAGWMAEAQPQQYTYTHIVPGTGGNVPPLPSFSAETCNAVLRGGPYANARTWVYGDADAFAVAGVPGAYRATGLVDDNGRRVFEYQAG